MCFVEARPVVLTIFLVRFLTGVALGAPAVARPDPALALASMLVCGLATFFVYLFNGVMDVREDSINGSRRPIASGELSPHAAMMVAGGAAALATASGFALGNPTRWTVPAALLLGYLYSGPPCYLKRWPIGTALVVTLAGLLTYYTGFAAYAGGAAQPGNALPILAAAMSLWMGLVGARTKDLSDVRGDQAAGRRTSAVVRGDERARLLGAAHALGLGVAFLAVATLIAPTLVWPAVTMLAGAAVVAFLSLSRLSRGSRSQCRRPYRAFMATQYCVHGNVLLFALT
jgi:4-hydroxybenzoate polyprenyltransferase